jgi:hypothetical protein
MGEGDLPIATKQRKWYKYKRNAKVGDVIRNDETAAGQTYKYARIIGIHVGSDGRVRSVDVEYKVPGESKFCITTRPIHKLVLVVPVEEQTMEEPGAQMEEKEEEDNVQSGPGGDNMMEDLDGGRPAAGGPLPADPDPGETEAGTAGEGNVEKATGNEEGPKEQGRGMRGPAKTHPVHC